MVSSILSFPKTCHLKSSFYSFFPCNPKPHRQPIMTETFELLNYFHLIYCFTSVADSGIICSPLLKCFHLLQSILFKICKPWPTQKYFFIIDFLKWIFSPGVLSTSYKCLLPSFKNKIIKSGCPFIWKDSACLWFFFPLTFFCPHSDIIYICTFSSEGGQEGNYSISYTLD